MSIVMHIAGTTQASQIPEFKKLFADARRELAQVAAFEGAEMLVNHREGRVQFLLQFRSIEECTAYLKAGGNQVLLPFRDRLPEAIGPFFFAVEGEVAAGAPAA